MWDIVLVMEEPVMEQLDNVLQSDSTIDVSVLNQKDSWLDWFDNLKFLRDFFKQKMQQA